MRHNRIGRTLGGKTLRAGAFASAAIKGLAIASITLLSATTVPGAPASSYVQDGLIACWDGIENAGPGIHDSSATVWKDLVAGREFSLHNVTVGADRMTFAGAATSYGNLSATDTTATFVAATNGTMEIVYAASVSLSDTRVILQSPGTSGFCFSIKPSRITGANASGKMFSFTSGTATNSASIRYDKGLPESAICNGASVSASGTDNWNVSGSETVIGTRAAKSGYHFPGSIYCIRLYNRRLTDEEIAANHNVDALRFILGDSAVLRVTGSPSDIGSPSPAYGVTNGLAAGASFLVSCGATSVTNTTESVQYSCTGWKLYDLNDEIVASGVGTSFTYTHPNPAEYRRLEWQWAEIQITDATEVSMKIDADGATADFTFKANASSRELLLGYGTTDAGTDTNAWANVVKLADVQAGATSLSNVALPAGCGTTWTVARAFLPREVTSLDYVQRGLILQYDAKENAGRGLHDAAPSVWKDLVGTNDLPLVAADSAEADAVLVSAGAHNTVGDIVGSYKPLMFEAYSKIVAFSGSSAYLPLVEIPNVGLIGFRNQQSAFFIRGAANQAATTRNSGQCYNDGFWNYDALGRTGKYRTMSAYLTWGAVSTTRNCYANGSKIPFKWYPNTNTDTMPSGRNLVVGADGISNRFRSIRIYDRELTAVEVAFNRKVDVARYEGGAFPAPASELVYAPAPLVVVRTSTVDGGYVSADITFGASSSARQLYVAYARTDAGTATNLYDGCDYVCDIAAGATSATVTFPASASGYLAARGGYRLALEKPATADDYVADGLIVQYDAKENAGRGLHDAAPSVWKDLVGTNDLPLVAADSAEADAVLVSAGAHNTVGDIVGSYKPLMFEAYSKIVAFSGSSAYLPLVEIPNVGLIGFRNQQSAFFIRCAANQAATTRNSGQCYNDGYWNYDELKRSGKYRTMSAYLKSGTVGTGRNCYANGSKIPFKWYPNTNTDTMPSGRNLVVGADGISNRFRSIRIYDRELTAVEVAFNRKVDVARYEGGASPIFEWSDFIKPARATVLYVR